MTYTVKNFIESYRGYEICYCQQEQYDVICRGYIAFKDNEPKYAGASIEALEEILTK